MICILGDKAGVPTGVPYFPQQRHEPDSSNYGYFDLKKNLGLIDRIPELRDRPEIRSLVEELNSSSGPFRSIGCDAWDLPDQPRPSEWISRGYVQVAFETLQLNNREEWISLFNSINSFDPNLTDSREIGLDLCEKAVSFRGEEEIRMSALIELFGWGRSNSQSRTNLRRAATALQEFFASEATRRISKPGRRISDLLTP